MIIGFLIELFIIVAALILAVVLGAAAFIVIIFYWLIGKEVTFKKNGTPYLSIRWFKVTRY